MIRARTPSFEKIIRDSEAKVRVQNGFDMYGKNLAFKTNCREVERMVSEDLRRFASSAKNTDFTVYGFLEPKFDSYSFLRSPPHGSVLVWKSLDHSQFHYRLGDTLIMYYTKNDVVMAVTLSFDSADASVCISKEKYTLYELCLFEMEKQGAKLLEDRGMHLVHASSIEMDGKGFLFPATSGFGKTFLTLVLLNNGHRLLSDDKTFVDPTSGLIYPYARRLRVDRRSIKLFPILKPYLKTTQSHFLNYKSKYFVNAEKTWPASRGEIAPLSYIIMPTIWIESKSKIFPNKIEHTLNSLITSMKLFSQDVTKSQKEMAFEIASKTPSYRLLIGTDILGIEKAIRAGIREFS